MNKIKFIGLFILSIVLLNSCRTIKKNVNTDIESRVFNKGVSGNTTVDLLNRLEVDVLNENPNLVILMVGTNDMLNSRKFVSYKKYESNLSQIVQRIKANNTQVLLLSTPTVDSIYLYQRHDKDLFINPPNNKLLKAKRIIQKISKDNNAFFLDLNKAFKNKNLPIHNEDDYIRNEKNSNSKDGVHLTPLGYKFMAKTIYSYLKSNNLLNKYKNIICFGDSLTKGVGAKGAGTITGENYPSYLNTMIKNTTIK